MRECITNGGFCVKNEENYCTSDICELEIENKNILNLNDEEQRTEHNTKVVVSFIEHCKENGFKIPDEMFETYFDA